MVSGMSLCILNFKGRVVFHVGAEFHCFFVDY